MISSPIMRCAYVAFGANLGDVERTYSKVSARLASLSDGRQIRCSKLRRTHAVGGPSEQPTYYNGCFEIKGGPPHEMLFDEIMELERVFGRTRTGRWGPRTIDLDLLLANEFVARPDIDVPHPRMHYRRFVLQPLVDLAPDVVHPFLLRTSAELLKLALIPDPTILLFSTDAALADAAARAIASRLPSARPIRYPENLCKPIILPAKDRKIATIARLDALGNGDGAVDASKCWALLLTDFPGEGAGPGAAPPLPTFDARSTSSDEALAMVSVFLDSLGFDWIDE